MAGQMLIFMSNFIVADMLCCLTFILFYKLQGFCVFVLMAMGVIKYM